jgi:hypothetical protein
MFICLVPQHVLAEVEPQFTSWVTTGKRTFSGFTHTPPQTKRWIWRVSLTGRWTWIGDRILDDIFAVIVVQVVRNRVEIRRHSALSGRLVMFMVWPWTQMGHGKLVKHLLLEEHGSFSYSTLMMSRWGGTCYVKCVHSSVCVETWGITHMLHVDGLSHRKGCFVNE